MHTSCVMYPSDVMFAFGKRKGTHHITDCETINITTAKAVASLARVAQTSLFNRALARFFFFMAKMLVYFLRFFALQRTPNKYGVGGFEPKQRLYTKKGINITSITEATLKAYESGDQMLRFDVAYLLSQVYRTSLDEIDK